MDYHSLPRKQLQALCKKHGIPANAANSEMADALTTLLKPKPPQKLEKRATRSHGPALTETVSMSNDVEEGSHTKVQKATESHKIPEEDSNKKLQRVTRGRGSASAVSEAPKSAASKTAKVPTDCQVESNSAAKQQDTRKVSTRNGATKQNNGEMPPHVEGNVNLKAMSPSDKKKEKVGGIVLRRGRVKVRSPRSLSKSPESAQVTKEVAVTSKEKGVGRPCSQSCLVDARKTRRKKRSVTFSDVIEINSASIEHAPEGCVPENDKEPAKDTVVDIQQDMDSSLLKNVNSASVAKKAIGTRKASRSVSTDTKAAQADHQKISKEPVAKVTKAISSEKTVSLESGGESDIKRAIRSKKTSNSAGDAAAKENATKETRKEKVTDDFVKGDLSEAAPCTRRSRRLTIVPTDVKFNHDPQLATEKLKGPKDQNEDISTAPQETEGDLPAVESSRRSRRKTLAPLELNHVQSTVKSASEQVVKKVSKSDKQSSKPKDASSVKNLCGSRQKAAVTSTDQHITSEAEVLTEMESTSILPNSEPDCLQEVSIGSKKEAIAAKTSVVPRSARKVSEVSTQPDSETTILQESAYGTQTNSVEHEDLVIVDEAMGKIIQDSENSDVIAPGCNEQDLADLVLENTNLARVKVPVCSTSSNEDMHFSNSCLCASQTAIDEEGEGLNPLSRDANSPAGNEELNSDICLVDVKSSTPKAIHCAAGDLETANASPLVDTESIEPDNAAAVQDQILGVTSPKLSRHEFSVEKDQAVKHEDNAMDESVATISSPKDVKDELRTIFPVSKMINEYESLDGTRHMNGIDLENSIENHTDKDAVASSPAANMESAIEISVDVHLLASDEDKIALTSGEAIAFVEQQLNQGVDLNLCEKDDALHEMEMKVQGDLQEEQLQDTNEAVPCDGAKSADNSTANDQSGQLSPLSPSCSVEPDTILPRESACTTKQWHPRAIFKSARKAQISKPLENTNLQDNTILDAETWGLNNPEMTSDEVDSVYSEDEGSSAEAEESLSDTETSNFKTEMLISNTEERDFSSSEDDTPSDSEKDTMFDSEEYFSEMEEEEELLSGEESYESEEQESSEEELSESGDDAEADFEEYEASPVSKSVAISENVDSVYITHGMEGKVKIIALQGSSEEELSESEDDAEADFEEYEASPVSKSVAISESVDSVYITHGMEDKVEIMALQESSAEELSKSEDDAEADFEEYEASTASKSVAISENVNAVYITHGMEDKVESMAAPESSLPSDQDVQLEIIDDLALEYEASPVSKSVAISKSVDSVYITHGMEDKVEIMTLQESSAEELSKSEDDAEADFEEYEASTASKSVAISENVDAVYITHGMEDKVESMAAPESSLPSDGDVQLEIIDDLALENDNECCAPDGQPTDVQLEIIDDLALENDNECCAPDGQPTDVDEKVGAQLEMLQKATLMHGVSQIQENVDALTNSNDNPSTDYKFQDLLSGPPSKVKEDVMCLLAPPGISEADASLQCGTLETELTILPESMQENSMQVCFASELTCREVLAEAEQHTMDGAKHGTGLCELVGGVENMLEVNSRMSELSSVQECCVEETLSKPMVAEIQKNVDVLISHKDNTAMEQMQSTTGFTYQDSGLLDSLSSLFASPPLKVNESSLAPPSIGIPESNVFQQSGALETEPNILPNSGQVESMRLCSPCEFSQNNVIAEVEQHILDGAEDKAGLCGSEGGVEKEQQVEDQIVELIHVGNCHLGSAAADHLMASPMIDNREDSQLLESYSSNALTGSKESEQIHSTASELPCLGLCELFVENIGAEMADPVPCEEVIQNLINAQEVQEEPGNLKMNEIVSSGMEEDEASNVQIKNDLGNNEGCVDMASDTQNGSKELMELCEFGEGTTAELVKESQVIKDATFEDSPLAVCDKLSEEETAGAQDLQSLVLANSYSIDDLPQKQNNEEALVTEGTTGSVVFVECANDQELGIGADGDKFHLFASGTSCDLFEEAEPLVQHECQQDILPFDVSQEQETAIIAEDPEALKSQSTIESLVSQVVASNTFDVDDCGTPEQSTDSEIASVFIHESLDEVAQTVDIASFNAQVEDIHKKPLDEIQTSEESKGDMETAVVHNLVPEITKEQSMKQIDLTLLSVRQLRQMCKGNLMSAKKKIDKEMKQKTENETPAKTPSRVWMSASKQVHQPNTSMQPRDVPSANKRSALKALSSNIKATPSAAMRTPTAKGSSRPLNLMSTYDGNDGIGKHLVTPSPQAPMSSKRDFARSHHR